MTKVRVDSFTISLNGYGAGLDQDINNPLGVGGKEFAISPVILGRGEWLFEGVDLRTQGYECVEFTATEKATHVLLRRQKK